MHTTKRDPLNRWSQAAIAHTQAAQSARQQYDHVLQAAIATYGDGDGRTISGIYRTHYPEAIKGQLRFYARFIGEQTEHAAQCWRKAGRRIESLRPILRRARTLEDGRVSYY